MIAINKYPLASKRGPAVSMPEGARIVRIACCQDGNPYVWALVDPAKACKDYHFELIASDLPFGGFPLNYVGSFSRINELQDEEVWHVFSDARVLQPAYA